MRYLLLVVLLCSCGHSLPRDAKVVHNQSYHLSSEAVKTTIAEMEQAQGQAFLSAKSDYVITIEFKPMPQGYLGSATLFGDRCLVRLTERLLAENYVYPPSRRSILRELGHTVRHEIGHCFGLKHSADVNDVMYPYMEYEQLDSESILTFNDILKKWRLQN